MAADLAVGPTPAARRCSAARSRATGARRGARTAASTTRSAGPVEALEKRAQADGLEVGARLVGRPARAPSQQRASSKPAARSRSSVSSGAAKFHGCGQLSKRSARPASSAARSAASWTAAMLPWPPHWATSRPPGRSAAASARTARRGRGSSGRPRRRRPRRRARRRQPQLERGPASRTSARASPSRSRGPCATISRRRRRRPRGRAEAGRAAGSVTRPVPQPASRTVSSPRSSSAVEDRLAHASCGSATRS